MPKTKQEKTFRLPPDVPTNEISSGMSVEKEVRSFEDLLFVTESYRQGWGFGISLIRKVGSYAAIVAWEKAVKENSCPNVYVNAENPLALARFNSGWLAAVIETTGTRG